MPTIHFLTLNLNQYATRYGPWPDRRRIISGVLQSVRPDLAAFQAVRQDPGVEGGRSQLEQICDEYPYLAQSVFHPAMSTAGGWREGPGLASRLPLGVVDVLPLTHIEGTEDPNLRVALHTGLEFESGELHFFNCHFSWVAEQAERNVAEFLAWAGRFEGPRMMAGDLNNPPDSSAIRQIRDAGWVDLWGHLRPGEPGYTFESGDPRLRIDYFFASPDLVSQVEAIEIVADRPGPAGERASDHFGLLLTLRVE